MTVRIMVGDVLTRLRELASDSVHCVICSPPYYGLRSYGIEPSVWGGAPTCAHEWGEDIVDSTLAKRGTAGSLVDGGDGQISAGRFEKCSAFCSRCGAWRGQLGLEPDWRMFIENIVSVFREVRRVLRPDGTLWLNMGDTYATMAGRVGEHPGGGKRGEAWAGRPPRGSTSSAGHRGGKTRADRDGSHCGMHVAMAAIGPMQQPNRMPQSGFKPKDRMMMPARVAIALQDDGLYLRDEIVWHKVNPIPSSVEDRTTPAHDMVYLFSKRPTYFYDAAAIAETASKNTNARSAVDGNGPQGVSPKSADDDSMSRAKKSWHRSTTAVVATRNKRSVWSISTEPFPEAHFATFPTALVEPCILAGTSARGCCAKCGAPWERVTVRAKTGQKRKMPDGMATDVLATETIGWWPGCSCEGLGALPAYPPKPGRAAAADEAEYRWQVDLWEAACAPVTAARRARCAAAPAVKTVPAVVLDCFGGAGTTALVADRLGRGAVLIEINPDYAEMARKRIQADGKLFAEFAAE